jgi:hypothetical protein
MLHFLAIQCSIDRRVEQIVVKMSESNSWIVVGLDNLVDQRSEMRAAVLVKLQEVRFVLHSGMV